MREAWDVSTTAYALLSTDGSVIYGNRRSAELFAHASDSAEFLAQFSDVPLEGHALTRVTVAPGVTVSGDLECIPVHNGRWVIFRLLAESAAEDGLTKAVLDNADSIIVVVDNEGRFVRFNRAAEILTGYMEEEVLGVPFFDLFLCPEEAQSVMGTFRELITDEVRSKRDNYWRMRDGSLRLISWSNTVLCDPGGAVRFIVSSGIDITEARRAQSALVSLSAQALKDLQGDRSTTSRFLHDTVAQDLVALSFSLSRLQKSQRTTTDNQVLTQSLELLDRCCRDVRLLSYLLAPPLVDEIGLVPALEWFGGQLQREAGMSVELDFQPGEKVPSAEGQSVLFAALQTCVARSVRRMDKSNKKVTLWVQNGMLRMRYDSITLNTEDGLFDVSAEFHVISERLRQISGEFLSLKHETGISVEAAVRLGES